MAQSSTPSRQWYLTALEWLGHATNIQTLLALAGGFGSMSWAAAWMPVDWNTQQAWGLAGLSFTIGCIAVSLTAKGARLGLRWLRPTKVRLDVLGGTVVTITVHVEQGADEFIAVGQMLRDRGVPTSPPYRMFWREMPTNRSKGVPIEKGDFKVVAVAKIGPPVNGLALLGADVEFSIRDSYGFVDAGPVLVRITLRGRSRTYAQRELSISFVASEQLLKVDVLS